MKELHDNEETFNSAGAVVCFAIGLYAAAYSSALAVGLGGIQATTRSGCTCSGFSNEHGFGRYCHLSVCRCGAPQRGAAS